MTAFTPFFMLRNIRGGTRVVVVKQSSVGGSGKVLADLLVPWVGNRVTARVEMSEPATVGPMVVRIYHVECFFQEWHLNHIRSGTEFWVEQVIDPNYVALPDTARKAQTARPARRSNWRKVLSGFRD